MEAKQFKLELLEPRVFLDAALAAVSVGVPSALSTPVEHLTASSQPSHGNLSNNPGPELSELFGGDGTVLAADGPAEDHTGATVKPAELKPDSSNGFSKGQALDESRSPTARQVEVFTQTATGETDIEIGGYGKNSNDNDQVNVAGAARLEGTLKIELVNGFVPEAGETFKIFTWGSRSGEFTKWLGTAGVPGHPDYYFKPVYNDHDLTLEVVADPDIVAAAKTAIENGLNTLSQVGTKMNDLASFSQNLPLIGDKLSSFLDSGAAMTNVLAQQIHNLFASGPTTAEAAVTSAIQSWNGTTVGGFSITVNGVLGHYDTTGGGPFWWDVNVDITPTAVNRTLQNVAGGALGAVFSSAPVVQVTSKLSLDMGFGYDGGFFLKMNQVTAQANVFAIGLSGFPFNFTPGGGLTVTSGSVVLSASVTGTPDPSILTANGTTGPRIEMATLTHIASSTSNVSDAFNLAKSGSLNASFTLSGAITGFPFTFAGTTAVNIQSNDLFAPVNPDVTVVVNGSIAVLNETLSGIFTFKKNATETDLLASGVTLNLNLGTGPGQIRVLQATGSGEFRVLGSDLAGTGSFNLTQGPNIPGLTIAGTTLELAFNTSSGSVATIDGTTVNLAAGPYYRVSGHGILGMTTPQASLVGDFVFEPRDTNSNPADGDEEVVVGVANLTFNFDDGSTPLLTVTNGSGAFVITQGGIYGKTSATATLTVPGVALSGTFAVLVNDTSGSVTSRSLSVNGAAVDIPALVAGPYLQVRATGATTGDHAQLTVLGTTLSGDFLFESKTTAATHKVVTVAVSNASFDLGTGTSNLLNITNGSGVFIMGASGLEGQGTVTLGINAPGLSLGGTFTFSINQTSGSVNETVTVVGSPITINLPAGPYLQVNGNGAALSFLGATLTGDFSFEQRTSTDNIQLVTVLANNVSFNFGSGILTASNGSGFFIINDSGISGSGEVDVHAAAFGSGFTHTFDWAFNNTDPSINETVKIGGILRTINQPDGPFNRVSTGGPVAFSITAGGQTQSISAALVLTLVHPDNDPSHDYVTAGVSGLSTTLGAGAVTLNVTGGTGAFVIQTAAPTKIAGEATVSSAALNLPASIASINATNLKLRLNNTGADVGPVSVGIDDNPADNVTIRYSGAYYHDYIAISGAAEIVLPAGFATLGGNFAFEVSNADPNQFKIAASDLHLDIKAGSTTVVSFDDGSGAFVMSGAGLAGIATLEFQAGIIGVSGTIGLEVNSTSSAVNTTFSGPTGPTTINLATPHYLKVSVNGNLRYGSVSLPLNFYVILNGGSVEFWLASPNSLLVTVDSTGNITPGPGLPSLTNIDFAQAGPFEFVSMLQQLGTWIDAFRGSSIFSAAIPFAGGKTLGDAFDWSQLFLDNIFSHLVSVELQSSVLWKGQSTFSAGGAVFQVQLDSGTPVPVTVGAFTPVGPAHATFTDADVQAAVALVNAGLQAAGLYVGPNSPNNKVEARENLAGQLAIALSDSQVAKGTKLSLVAADAGMDTLGFGPVDSNPATTEHVAALTARYSTDGSSGSVGLMTVLSDLLNDGVLNNNGTVNYQAAQQVYTFDVDSSKFLPASYSFDVPLSFNQDFGPIANAQLDGKLTVSASVGFHFTLGFDLGAQDVPRVLSSSQVPVPANGRLSDDAHFEIFVNGDTTPLLLTLPKTVTTGNNSVDDLAADLNDLFANPSTPQWNGSALSQILIAQKAGTGLAISAKSTQLGIINRLAIVSPKNDSFATEMGFGMQLSPDQQFFLSASNSNVRGLFIDHASLSGALSVAPDLAYNPNGISGSLRFGFVDITVPSGTVQFVNSDPSNPTALTASLSLQDHTTNATRFYISDLMHGTSSDNILNMVSGPNLAGGFRLQLNNITVGGLGFTFPLGTNPQVTLFVPDVKNFNYNEQPYDPITNNEGLFLTYPNLGDLGNFTSLNFTQIIEGLQGIASSLSQLSAFSFLNERLPLIDMSVNEMIGYAAKFANLVDAAANGGSQSLQETLTNLKTQIDEIFHLDPSILSIDVKGIAPSSLATSGGDATHPSATTPIQPEGDNNDFIITASSNGASLNGSTIRIIGSPDITGTTAQASWDAGSKILTIKIDGGHTTTNAIITALTGTPWTAAATPTDNTRPNSGDGYVTTVALKFGLNFSVAYANSLPFQLDLKKLVESLGGTNPAVAALLDAATTLLDVSGSGTLTVSASAALTLDFGLDLTNPSSIRPFFYDTSGIVLRAKVLGTNISFQASLGSVVGIYIENGTLTLDGDGDPSTNASSATPDNGAEFRLGLLDNDHAGRHYLDEDFFNSANIDLHLKGGVSAILPIFAPIEGVPLGNTADNNHDGYADNALVVQIPDLVRLFVSEVASTSATGANATIVFAGVNNDLQIQSTTHTDYGIKFLSNLSGNTATASFDTPTNTLIVNVDSASTTASTALTAIKTVTGFSTSALTSDDDGNPAAPHSNDGTGMLAKVFLASPDFGALFANLNFCDIISNAAGPLLTGLDTLLGKIQDGLNSIVSATKLPLIGDGLSGAANFIQNFRDGLLKELRDDVNGAGGNGITAVENAIKKAFWNTLGPGGLDILVDPATGNPLDGSLGFSQLNVQLDCNTGLVVKLRLKKEIALVDTSGNPIKFDIGVPGFGLKGDGNVIVSVGFDLKFGFGVSPDDGFYFDSSAPASDPELQIYFKVTIPKLHFSGQLLFLQLDIGDNAASPSSFNGHFSVDLKDPNGDGKLTWAELTSSGTQLSDLVHAELGADAIVNLDLIASFGGDAAFPRVLAQFHLIWHFDVANGAGTPQISFDHIFLDLGSFISNFLAPILHKIQEATSPIQPIIDVVQARIPILSDLAGQDITLLDLARIFGLLEPSTVSFIQDVAGVITLIDQIQGLGSGDILIPFGSFNLSGDSSGNMSHILPKQSPSSINLGQVIANDPDPGVSSSYQSAAAGFAGSLSNLHNFSIPVFDHPSELFNLFIGKPVRLVEWRMPQFKFEFTYVQKIPIYPPLYAEFGGKIGATINIGFGYDTFGIQKFIDDPKKDAVDLLDGFYIITNDANGQPQPALSLTGEIFAGASIDLVIVEVGVRGGISATVNFFWNDNSDNDGKMRVSEIVANALEDPRCIFNIEGSISLFLEAYLKIDLFFFSIDKTWRFATITLVTFDLSCPAPVLGEMSGGTLTLNIGSRAALRLYDDTSDGSETFIVRHVDGDLAGGETVDVTWAQHRQQFKGVKDIEVPDAGQGNDVIDLRNVLATSHVNGGTGDDTIYLSDGPNSTADGGAGDDKIVASKKASATGVVIHGGDGNDTISAGTVSITIYGDAGQDTISGSPLADMLYGGAGDDIITGGDGDDFIDGGDGHDTISGGNGNDFILAGAGDDVVNGGPGDDVIDAGDGDDLVYGGSGNDVLIGGNGNERMYGDGGSDLLIGDKVVSVAGVPITFSPAHVAALNAAAGAIPTAGIDVHGIYGPDDGKPGNDFLVGGGGADVLFGGNGDDFLYGGNFLSNGDTSPIEEDNNDFIDGGPGNDLIFGDDSMGRTGDRNTGIAINSSIWYDQNLNGTHDSNETGLGGVTVWLYTQSTPPPVALPPGSGSPVAQAKTDVDGSFQFVGLDPNHYIIVFSLPATLAFVTPAAANVTDSATDSDANPTGTPTKVLGETPVFFVDYNQTFKAVSAGYTGNARVSISNSSVAEGNDGQSSMVFNVTLSGPQSAPVEIDYSTANGNDIDPAKNANWETGDYQPVPAQILIFNPGETSKQITILVNGDTTYEASQQFQLLASAVRLDPAGVKTPLLVNNSSGTVAALGTILNDDPIPTISIQDYNPAAASPRFSVGDFPKLSAFIQTLSAAADPVSAFTWSQFSPDNQQLLTSGKSTDAQEQLILVSELNAVLEGPSIYTASRFAAVILSHPTSVLLASAPTGDKLILLNRLLMQDAYPTTLARTIAGETEGSTAKFIITLSNPSEYTITSDWRTDASLTAQALPAPDAATPSPLPGADFTSGFGTFGDVLHPGLTFQPGVTTQIITVPTVDDTLSEGPETFWVELSNPRFATIADSRGYGIIQDNDPLPSVTIVPQTPVGGPFRTEQVKDPHSPETVYLQVKLSAPSGQDVTVTWGTSPGTAVESLPKGAPTYPDLPDYVGFPNSTTPDNQKSLVFKPGDSLVQTIAVQVNPTKPYANPADTKDFFVNVLSADHATIAANPAVESNHVTVVIKEAAVPTTDAGPWSIFFSSNGYQVQEPTMGSTIANITINRTAGSSHAEAVFYTTDGTATAGLDYAPVFRQIVNFAPNELSKTIPITIFSDSLVEGDETVVLSLKNPTGGPVRAQPDTAVLTIHDGNEPFAWVEAPRLSPAFTPSSFSDLPGIVAKLNAHSDPVSLFLWNGFSAADKAVLGNPSSTLAALQTAVSTELNLLLLGSSVYDPARFAGVTLSGSTSDFLAQTPAASGGDLIRLNRWLLEDAYPLQITKSSGIIEGSGLISTDRDFIVHLSAPVSSGDVFVSYETVSLTARSDLGPASDFTATSGTLHFTAGMNQIIVHVPVFQDQTPELNETFALRLKNAVNATLNPLDSAALATIYDDDLKQISFNVFYDANGNGFDDLGESGIPGLVPALTVRYANAGTPVTATVTDAGNGVYTANVLLGQVNLVVNGTLVKSPYVMSGPGSSYKNTTQNENQSVKYEGLEGLPSFADIGYVIKNTSAVNKGSTKDVGRGGTDDTIFGGPGDDTIDAGGGDDHVVGGHWMTATDSNMPINDTSTFNQYDASVKVVTSGLHVIYGNGNGPEFYVDTSGLNLTGSIAGQIWLDTNNNNQKDAGETFTGQDVVVTLFDCDGNIVNQTVTNTGVYSFTNLPAKSTPSTYVVQFDIPKGYVFLSPNPAPPAPAATNNDVLVGGRTGIVSVTIGSPAISNLDAGIRPGGVTPVSGGFQFSDPAYSVSEAVIGGILTITVQRSDAYKAQPVVVHSQDGTAIHTGPNKNYQAISTLLEFAVGETIKTVDIPIFNTNSIAFCSNPLTFTVELRDPTGKPIDSATVYIGGQSYGSLHDDDIIQGGDDWDIILGDSGNIPAAAVMDTVGVPPIGIVYSGGLGNDTINGGNGPDFINGQLGKDILSGDNGIDLVLGDMGNDTIYVSADDDTVDGGYGFDTVISTRDVANIQLTSTGTPNVATLTHKDDLGAVLSIFTLKNIEMAQLYGGPVDHPGGADNTFDITNWNGSAFAVGNGGNDTLLVQNHIDMKLVDASAFEGLLYKLFYGFVKDSALVLASGGKYDLSSIERTVLTISGGVGGNTVDASGYSRPVTFKDLDGNNTFIGGSAGDSFIFNADTLTGTDTITGNGGQDTIDFSSSLIQGVTANLATLGGAQSVTPALELKLLDKIENATGGAGNDTLTGNDLDNVLIGGPGSDILAGGPGSETYVFNTDSAQGDKTIIENIADPGFDTLDFSGTTHQTISLNMSIIGSPQTVNANLTLTLVGEGVEQVIGGGLNDVIRGNSNDNVLRGGLGDDILDGKSGNDVLDGGPGNNTLIGGPGIDTISEQGDTNFALTDASLKRGTGPVETLDGIENVNLTGGPHANVFNLNGFTGTGTITGGAGLDTVIAAADANFTLTDSTLTISTNLGPIGLTGVENARLTDGPGAHTLDASGFSGVATLNGGEGDDTLIGGPNGDIIDGGLGNNTFIETSDASLFVLHNDKLVTDLTPASGDEHFTTLARIQNVTLNGGPGSNVFDLIGWTAGHATVNGMAGLDAIRAQAPAVSAPAISTVTVSDTAMTFTGGGGVIALSSIEEVAITGTSGNDVLDASGFSGASALDGAEGDDVLIAGRGLSVLRGGPGNDHFVFRQFGATHSVYILAGDGEDTLDFSAFTAPVAVDLSFLNALQAVASGELGIDLVGSAAEVEDIIGGQGGGALFGNALDNSFTITGGANTIDGGGGTNTVIASANSDFALTNALLTINGTNSPIANIQVAVLTGGNGDNTLDATGFTGSTILDGGPGNDRLLGGSGNDILIGGAGDDLLRGSAGNDTYLFNVDIAEGADTVDEVAGGGVDTLDFSASHAVGVRVDLSLTTQQTVAPNLQLTITHNDGVENVIGTDQPDVLVGNGLNNTFTGGAGNDTIDGGGGTDMIKETRDANFVLTDSSLEIYRPALFDTSDIKDLAGLVAKLQSDPLPQTQAVSQFLWAQFSSTAKQVLADPGVSIDLKKTVLVGELNRVIQAGTVYDSTRFAAIVLGSDTADLKNQNPTGQDLVRLNRWILDDVYFTQIATSHERDTLTSVEGATLTGGASDNIIDCSAFTLGSVFLFGMDGNDVLIGGYRNDRLDGGNGNDALYGGASSDILLGGAGDDTLNGCGYIDITKGIPDGDDLLFGGAGNDKYVFDITAQKPTPDNPGPHSPIPQGTDHVFETFGEGYADVLIGLGPNIVAVDLHSAAPQTFQDANGTIVLTLILASPGQVEFSF